MLRAKKGRSEIMILNLKSKRWIGDTEGDKRDMSDPNERKNMCEGPKTSGKRVGKFIKKIK